MQFKWTQDLTHPIYQHALEIRKAVFIKDQGIDPQLELDGQDDLYYHVVGYDQEQPICVARIKIDRNILTVQRVAVLSHYQRQGVGRQLMNEIKQFGQSQSVTQLFLSAQHTAVPFYESLGYTVVEGSQHMDAGILHFDMKQLI
ncbi:GNAT family N-acetyltransferase [Dolosicoccus paucivorans]|uniref:GNAT family N-acetyltransferase n=1 Tax=Dolosicoccus paucivorans TaxID=84521 RepID=UPI00088572A2|nr:GNAT family N-acetyltransferase [Dolosicoccus paucivorans]SDI22683.1 Predicted N-acyltransferase, GNAT family [Dolosicoccus paucivorans]